MKVRITVALVAAAVLAVASLAAPTAEQLPFGRIVVFGTSLSDAGNAFALRRGTNTPPEYDVDAFLVPGSPYSRGGHHFTNGATWIEQFARSRGLAGSVRPAFASSDPNATNYAVGGARAYDDGINLDLAAQVGAFLERFGGAAPPDALYVIEMGGNDIRDALVVYAGGGDGQVVLQAGVVSIANAITALYAAGARQFLVWRAPNVGLAPAIHALEAFSPGAVQLATQLSVGFNTALDAAVAQLSAGLAGITIVRLDAFTLLNDIVADPPAFGLTNVTAPCVTPNVPPFACQRPDEYLFWDGIHPTAAAHAIVAGTAGSLVGQ